MLADTTLYTGFYDAANDRGFLATLTYREPQGVSLWQLRLQWGTLLSGQPGDPRAVESVNLTFLTRAAFDAFTARLTSGTVQYFVDKSDPAGSFAEADDWRVARLSGSEDAAVLTFNDSARRAELVIRDPIVTIQADGTATVRDGGPDGAVRTRYYRPGFTLGAGGQITTGTLDRTLLTFGDPAGGAIISRTEFPDGSFRESRQLGGDGLILRTNVEG